MKNEFVSSSGPGFQPFNLDQNRRIEPAKTGDPQLGPLKMLPGTWANIRMEDRKLETDNSENPFSSKNPDDREASPLNGRGWNIIALPFIRECKGPPYRVLMNQYNEVLHFDLIDAKVPNRGVKISTDENTDQEIAALDYTQQIRQLKAADDANSGKALTDGLPIHHEPGFFLNMKKQTIDGFTIARLATIPHGNTANAVGKFIEYDGAPTIPPLSALPDGASTFDIEDAVLSDFPIVEEREYLQPYRHFIDNPFLKTEIPPFPGFQPRNANHLLELGLGLEAAKIRKTTELVLDTDAMEAGIVNIPFIERQADPSLMRSTFWIMELEEEGPFGEPRLLLAYSQLIFLDFFQRRDGRKGLSRWPHVSINIMEKIAPPPDTMGL